MESERSDGSIARVFCSHQYQSQGVIFGFVSFQPFLVQFSRLQKTTNKSQEKKDREMRDKMKQQQFEIVIEKKKN